MINVAVLTRCCYCLFSRLFVVFVVVHDRQHCPCHHGGVWEVQPLWAVFQQRIVEHLQFPWWSTNKIKHNLENIVKCNYMFMKCWTLPLLLAWQLFQYIFHTRVLEESHVVQILQETCIHDNVTQGFICWWGRGQPLPLSLLIWWEFSVVASEFALTLLPSMDTLDVVEDGHPSSL